MFICCAHFPLHFVRCMSALPRQSEKWIGRKIPSHSLAAGKKADQSPRTNFLPSTSLLDFLPHLQTSAIIPWKNASVSSNLTTYSQDKAVTIPQPGALRLSFCCTVLHPKTLFVSGPACSTAVTSHRKAPRSLAWLVTKSC